MSHSPKLAARATGLTQAEVKIMRDKQAIRYATKQQRDPLIIAAASRPYRTPSAIHAGNVERAARAAAIQADIDRTRLRQEREDATRNSLILAARAARALGFEVRASARRDGAISSYYCSSATGSLRISDHDIPATPRREFMAQEHGREFYDGYHGAQLIIDQPRRYEWLRRAIVLAAAGRRA
jgi:hypothetical protein